MRLLEKVAASAAWLFASRKRRRAMKEEARLRKAMEDPSNEIRIHPDAIPRVRLSVSGRGNKVTVGRLDKAAGVLDLRIFGSGCSIEVADGVHVSKGLTVVLGIDHHHHGPVEDASFSIGEDSRVEECKACTMTSHSRIELGKRCLVSIGVTLYNTDAHPVYRLGEKVPCNAARILKIGDHVWLGANATLLKNVHIADDCIIGWGSVVAGKFERPHCAIGGNPARVLSEGVTWDVSDPLYLCGQAR